MVSTVTTTTVSTVTTVAVASSLALVTIVTLLTLLIQKEVVSSTQGRLARALNRALNIGIVPLLLGFLLIVAMKIVDVLK